MKKVDSIYDRPKEFGNFLREKVINPSGRYKFEDLYRSIAEDDFSIHHLNDEGI